MDCIFCKIAQGVIKTDFLFEDEDLVAFRDLNPQAPTHVLVIPKRHIERVNDLKSEDAQLAGKMTLAAASIAKELGIAHDGYRLVMNCNGQGGQEVYHLHMHLLGGRQMKWPPG